MSSSKADAIEPIASLSSPPVRSSRLVAVLASAALAVGLLTLIERLLGSGLPRAPGPAMSALTASGVVVLAGAVFAVWRGRRLLSIAAGGAAVALALAVLCSYVMVGADAVSAWWASRVLHLAASPGLTSRSTATAIGLLGMSLLLNRRTRVANAPATAALVLSVVALLGYAYGAEDLYAMVLFNNMAPRTAFALFLIAIATLCLDPGRGWSAIVVSRSAAGAATRRQLVFALLLPLIGWAIVEAVHGGRLGVGAAMAMFAAGTVVPLSLLILRDGTRLVALDDERRRKDAELAAAAEDAQAQLKRQSRQLAAESAERQKVQEGMERAQRLEAIGQLTGGIAHDFNNLLMIIGGNVQLLRRRVGTDDPLRRYVENLGAAVSKGAKVTQQLLAFSRSQRLDIRPHRIETVVADARQLIGSSLGPSVRVEIGAGAPGVWAQVDGDQLELALLNLAVNARDAMQGEGVLTIACSGSTMAQAAQGSVPCVLIRVTDTGSGMTAEVAARAAEPFYTTKERGKGTGLGLAQVYGVVMQCQGEFRIVSAPGQGTTVELRFPLAEPPVGVGPVPALESPTRGVAGAPRRVIVIDDDEGVREVIVQALSEAGYDVTSAVDGESGLAQLRSFEPAAAVIDFIMPGMHGADVARAARKRYPGLPIIFVSGYADTTALEGVSGASVLRKPFDVSALTQMVDLAISP